MRLMTKIAAAAAGAVGLAAATPAAAQYYGPYYDPYYDPYDRETVYEVIDGVARVAGAVAAVTRGYDPYFRGRYGYRPGAERYAADVCAWEAQRRYGRVGVDIRDVRWSRPNRLLVLGAVDLRGRYGWYGRYGRYGYDPYRRIAFSCRIRPDGRVIDFDTHRYDW